MGCHGARYPDGHAWVNAIISSLEGDSVEWLVSLHEEGLPELQDLDAFMQHCESGLKTPQWFGMQRFASTPTAGQTASDRVHLRFLWPIRLAERLVRAYAGLPILERLNKELYLNCLPQGVPRNL